MKRPVKWALWMAGLLAALVIVALSVGATLPQSHTAAVRVTVNAAPADVYALITDVSQGAAWRDDVDSVTVLSSDPVRWTEHTGFGDITFVREAAEQYRLVRNRIEGGEEQGFGGTWTWKLEPAGNGTVVTITENGEVYSAFFRVMSKYVFGHYSGLESYAGSIAKKFGQAAGVERIQ